MKVLRALRRHGVLGINRRNAEYTLRWNPRGAYPAVDDKLLTKDCVRARDPDTAAARCRAPAFRAAPAARSAGKADSFVLKPARGAMGNGILVICDRDGARFRLAAVSASHSTTSPITPRA